MGQVHTVDFFVEHEGVECAGRHVLLELWQAVNLSHVETIEAALSDAAAACGATLLNMYVHKFGTEGGVTGVAVIAESHISIHTWPERGYAAIDVFMCGDCNPHKAIPVFRRVFRPGQVQLSEHKRGVVA